MTDKVKRIYNICFDSKNNDAKAFYGENILDCEIKDIHRDDRGLLYIEDNKNRIWLTYNEQVRAERLVMSS